jgi:hypothetical protein
MAGAGCFCVALCFCGKMVAFDPADGAVDDEPAIDDELAVDDCFLAICNLMSLRSFSSLSFISHIVVNFSSYSALSASACWALASACWALASACWALASTAITLA